MQQRMVLLMQTLFPGPLFREPHPQGPAVIPTSAPASATIKSGSKGSKITAYSLAIMGLQHLLGHAGTSKQIIAVELDPMLAKGLNWRRAKEKEAQL
ncbi:TPA: hypothetical protein ACH3X1_007909 [Trebouxia sp. C0004]